MKEINFYGGTSVYIIDMLFVLQIDIVKWIELYWKLYLILKHSTISR